MHQVTILFSDRGTPKTYRHMNGYGSHTFSLINAQGKGCGKDYTQAGDPSAHDTRPTRLSHTKYCSLSQARRATFNATDPLLFRADINTMAVVAEGFGD